MRVLFLHQNFPGQFIHVARALHGAGHVVRAITDAKNGRPDLVPTLRYELPDLKRPVATSLVRSFAERARRGGTTAEAMLRLRNDGFEPDLVIGHFGWGETLFVKDVWPKTRLIAHAEFYYSAEGADFGFDPEFQEGGTEHERLDQRMALRARNAAILLAMESAEFGIAPTQWQGSRFPKFLQSRIAIMHEGIDTSLVRPDPDASIRIGTKDAGLVFKAGDEVVTFVNRNLEPYRGYHRFMRALPAVLAARPNAHVVIVGGDGVSYGPSPPGKRNWKKIFLDEVKEKLPLDRVHFVGLLPYHDFVSLLQVSAAHVYLTYPFVLSWSMLEAMSAGALVIGSSTAPVQEVIEHGRNGLLVDFFDHTALSEAIIRTLAEPAHCAFLRTAARQTIVERYDLRTKCLPQWLAFAEIVGGHRIGGSKSQLDAGVMNTACR